MNGIWVGEAEGNALVYDPAIQISECPHLFLWDPLTGEMGKYLADRTRKRIKPHGNPAIAAEFKALYENWLNSHGSQWLAVETRFYETRKQQELAREVERKLAHERQAEALLARERERKLAHERQAEALKERAQEATQRHKDFLLKLGKTYAGVRLASPSVIKKRMPLCYSCLVQLDGANEMECVTCGWLTCWHCGACGCGYSRGS